MIVGQPIPDGDSLFRHSIKPVSFKGKTFAPQKLIALFGNAEVVQTSLAWQRYVPTTELVHSYGCRLALRRNDERKAEGTFKEKNRQVYCGAYQIKAVSIRALVGAEGLKEVVTVEVFHHVEEGEIAHTDLTIILNAKEGFDVEGTKTAIVDRLWNACSGPLLHVCDCDDDLAPHPSSELITAPGGPYRDDRHDFLRLWSIMRFRLYERLCRRE